MAPVKTQLSRSMGRSHRNHYSKLSTKGHYLIRVPPDRCRICRAILVPPANFDEINEHRN